MAWKLEKFEKGILNGVNQSGKTKMVINRSYHSMTFIHIAEAYLTLMLYQFFPLGIGNGINA